MSITARGRGVVRVPRDRAELHLGLEFSAAAAADALAGAQAAQADAMTVLLRRVDERQVSSEGLRLHPDYRDGTEAGFVAGHSLRVSGLEIEHATELVAALAEEVGDRLRLHGLELVAQDTRDAEVAARQAAWADAHARAEHLAALAGARLGAVVAVTDAADGGLVPVATASMSAKDRAGSVQGGEAEIEQSVTVTWELVVP